MRCDSKLDNNWIKVKCIGVKSNRSAIGARVKCVTHPPDETKPHQQIDEVRSGGGYISQNDLRIHFGLGKADKVELLEVRWPSGQVDTMKDVKVNQLVMVKEGQGIVKTEEFAAAKRTPRQQVAKLATCAMRHAVECHRCDYQTDRSTSISPPA